MVPKCCRLACCFAVEKGIEIVAPVHDALVLVAPLDQLKEHVAVTRDCMEKASRAVLGGFALRTEVKIVRYPHHYSDPRGTRMWNEVWNLCRK